MGFIDNLFKSPQQKEREAKEYYEWAYPYGDPQKKVIDELVKDFVSDEDPRFAVYNYLVCKQNLVPSSYIGKYDIDESNYKSVSKILKKQYIGKGKKSIHKYIALVEADSKIDESLNYPSLEELENRANVIKEMIG